jgi:hypothetical protein
MVRTRWQRSPVVGVPVSKPLRPGVEDLGTWPGDGGGAASWLAVPVPESGHARLGEGPLPGGQAADRMYVFSQRQRRDRMALAGELIRSNHAKSASLVETSTSFDAIRTHVNAGQDTSPAVYSS